MNSFDEAPADYPELMPIQLDLLARGSAAYQNRIKRVIWQAPCGSGKTIVAAEQTRRALAKNKTVLHIVHRRRLVDQMISTLLRFGIRAAAIMKDRTRWNSPVNCASRDTLLAMLEENAALPKADLLIWDECHVTAEKVQQFYLREFPMSYWTGYTATPVGPGGTSLNPPYQALVCMAPTSKMIELGRLVPVKVFNPDAIGRRRRKGDKVKPAGDPVDHWKKYSCGRPTVVYAATVAESQAICQKYNDAGIPAAHLDASTPEDEREDIFEKSRMGEIKIICNCGVLIEGIDLPWLSCCQILRGCNSLVLWMQANGRVMRSFEGKDIGICLDHAAAAFEFGVPDRDFKWSLEDERSNAKNNKPSKDKKPITCLGCGLVFSGQPVCPECGRVVPVKKRKSLLDGIKAGDGLLTEFTDEQRQAIDSDRLTRLFKRCYFIAKAKGGTMRQVAGMFGREAKIPPWKADLSCKVPTFNEWDTPAKDWKL